VGSPAYGEGTTLQMEGEIAVKGHTPVKLEDLFAPTDQNTPVAFYIATAVMSDFSRIYSNPYELPQIDHVDIHVKSLAEKRWATIDNAWVEHSEVRPGESLSVKVLLRPYRGAPFIQEIPVTIPAQATRGSLQLVVSGADFLNRNVQSLAATSQGQLPGLEELIQLTNRERHSAAIHADNARGRQGTAQRADLGDQRPRSAPEFRQRPAAAAIHRRRVVGRNASGDCGPAHVDHNREVIPRPTKELR
jgi:hypothetical protein